MQNEDAKIIAEGIVKGFEKTANGIEKSSEKNAQAIMEGFRETAKIIGKSLGGTRAELMMDCLLTRARANGGKIPEPDIDEWNTCKKIAEKVLEEF